MAGVSLRWLGGDRAMRELCGVCGRGESCSSQLLEKHPRQLLLREAGKARKDLE